MVAQAVIGRYVLREVLSLESRSRRRRNPNRLRIGSLAPQFTARLLGTSHVLSTCDLKGRFSIFLFLNGDKENQHDETLVTMINGLWSKAEGNLYLVCKGEERKCSTLRSIFPPKSDNVIWDRNGEVTQTFGITNVPCAVELNEKVRVSQYGEPT